MRIRLSTEQAAYLLREKFLVPNLLALIDNAKCGDKAVILQITEECASEFRDAFGERLQKVGFDKEYEPTSEGKLLESLVDRFNEDQPNHEWSP